MLIDIHAHTSRCDGILRQNGSRYPTPEELIETMDVNGIDKAVILSTISMECRFVIVTPHEVMAMTKQYPERFIPFCNLDPRMLKNHVSADFTKMLNFFKEAGFKGIGEYYPNIELDHPLNMNVFRQVEEVGGLPITFHLASTLNYNGQYGCCDDIGLSRLEKVLKSFSRQIFLAHSQVFWAEISSDVTEDNRCGCPKGKVTEGRVVELMRKYPNLHGDLSAGSGLNAISRDLDFGIEFMEEFQNRLYFGTDIANHPQKLPQIQFFKRLKNEQLISGQAYEKITWRNAAGLFNLDIV